MFRRESDPWARGRPPGRINLLAGLVWIGFIIVPVVDALTNPGRGFRHWLVVAAAVTFAACYVWLISILFDDGSRRLSYVLTAVMLSITVVLTLADRSNWGYLFSYCSALVALVLPSPFGFSAVLACTGLAVICTSIGGAVAGTAFGYGASTVGVGLLLTLLRDLRVRNQELNEARAELARTAVAEERERFARDLHDLLGHSLSVIAIKAELGRRLLPERPDQAAVEIGEVEHVARQALGEVRDAVSGYRQPTLKGELRGARVALSAAGIEAEVGPVPDSLDPEVEAVLAWAVREGATNVIRHSGAKHCQVKISATPEAAGLEVLDDGTGMPSADGRTGTGLAGLNERAASLRGQIEAGGLPGGGFRLAVSLPIAAAS
ncbi:MAG: sensor histidine kinase [Solirubrobacteraceae bacterium]